MGKFAKLQALHADDNMRTHEAHVSTQELIDIVAEATRCDGDTGCAAINKRDAAWLLAFLRCGHGSCNGGPLAHASEEARKITELLCDWTLPKQAIVTPAGGSLNNKLTQDPCGKTTKSQCTRLPRIQPPPPPPATSRKRQGE